MGSKGILFWFIYGSDARRFFCTKTTLSAPFIFRLYTRIYFLPSSFILWFLLFSFSGRIPENMPIFSYPPSPLEELELQGLSSPTLVDAAAVNGWWSTVASPAPEEHLPHLHPHNQLFQLHHLLSSSPPPQPKLHNQHHQHHHHSRRRPQQQRPPYYASSTTSSSSSISPSLSLSSSSSSSSFFSPYAPAGHAAPRAMATAKSDVWPAPKQIRFVHNQGQPPSKRRRISAAYVGILYIVPIDALQRQQLWK